MAQQLFRRSALSLRARPGRLVAAAGLAASLGAAASGALINASWTSAVSGTWSTASNWTPGVNAPNNGTPPGDTYHATINATGANYTVTLNSAVTLDMLTLNSAFALISHTSGNFNPGAASIQAGAYRLNGGNVTGGAWTVSGPGRFEVAANSNNLIQNAMISGDILADSTSSRTRLAGTTRFDALRLQGSFASAGITGGYTLHDDIVAEGAGGSARLIEMNGSAGTFTIGATGAVTHAAGVGGDLTIGANQWFGGAMTLVNNGLIENNSGRTTSISAASFTNNGTLRLTSGTTSINAWSNSGTVEVSGGTLNLGAFDVTSGIGAWNRTGGVVNINGALNNAASSFALDDSTGSWTLNGGSITGGTVDLNQSAQLLFGANSNNLLADVDINGDLTLAAGSARTRLSGAARFDTLRLQNSFASVGVAGGYTLHDAISAEGAGGAARLIEMNGTNGTFTIGATGTVTHAAGVGGDLSIGGLQWFGGSMTLVNNGLIENSSGRTTSISAASFTNNGTLRLTSGTTSINSWSNNGTVEVSGGTLNLGAFDVTSGIGSWNRTGGTVNINGALNNAASSFALDDSTGSWTLNGGSITGGTVDLNQSAQLLFGANSNNLLADVDINGDLTLAAGSARTRLSGSTRFETARLQSSFTSIGVVGGYTLHDDIVAEGAAGSGRLIEMNGSNGTFTIGATGAVTHAAGVGGDLTIGATQWFGGAMTLVNNGLIENNSGRTTTISAASFTNNGTLRLTSGTTSINAWSNSGTVEVSGGTLNLGAFDVTSGIGAWNRTGGVVNINGAINNAGNTFDLDNSTGSWTLNGGSITGGTVNLNQTAELLFGANSGNLLADVDVNGDLTLAVTSARTRLSGAARFDTLRLQNNFASVGVVGGYTLHDDIVAEGAAGSGRLIEMNGSNGTFTIGAAGSIAHAAGVGGDLTIGATQWFGGAMTLVNNGLIENNSGRTTSISAASFTNNGTLRLTSGTTSINAWSNSGTVEVSGGTLNLGAFDITSGIGAWSRTGGVVNINGAIANPNSFTLDDSTGSWTLNGGSITGGAVNFGGAAQLQIGANSGNLLADVDINGDLTLAVTSARTRLSGAARFDTLRLQNSFASVGVAGGYTLHDAISAEGAGGSARLIEMNGSAGTFTIGATGTVAHAAGAGGDLTIGATQWFGGAMTLVNNGLIENNSARVTSITAASFTNNGAVAVRGGGTTSIDSTGAAPFVNNGQITAGPGGTIRFVDGYNAAASTGDLTVQLGGALTANYGRINITAPTTINGADIDIALVNGFNPDWGDKFTILTFDTGEVTGDFSTFVLPALADAVNWRWYTEETATAVSIGVRHTADVNRDNSINFSDLNIIVSNFNTNGSAAMGDVDGDGFIGFADLNRVVSFFNTSAPVNTVPAPAGAALLAGLLGAVARRRR